MTYVEAVTPQLEKRCSKKRAGSGCGPSQASDNWNIKGDVHVGDWQRKFPFHRRKY
jgi:hypothetical protein